MSYVYRSVAELSDFNAKFLVLLRDILPESTFTPNSNITSSTGKCSDVSRRQAIKRTSQLPQTIGLEVFSKIYNSQNVKGIGFYSPFQRREVCGTKA